MNLCDAGQMETTRNKLLDYGYTFNTVFKMANYEAAARNNSNSRFDCCFHPRPEIEANRMYR